MDRTDGMMAVLVLIWGTAFASIKVLSEAFTPLEILWYRYVPFIAFFVVWLPLRRRHVFATVSRGDWWRFAVMGVVGVAGYHIPVNLALQADGSSAEITAATGAVLIATTPIWALLFTVATGREAFDRGRTLGTLIAFAGVVVLVFLGKGEAGGFSTTHRALLILLAPILWSWYSIIGKPLVDRYGGLFTTGVSMTLGTLYLLPIGVQAGIEPLRQASAEHLAWMAYLGMAATLVGYIIWNEALKARTATELTSYIYFIPVVATLAGLAWPAGTGAAEAIMPLAEAGASEE